MLEKSYVMWDTPSSWLDSELGERGGDSHQVRSDTIQTIYVIYFPLYVVLQIVPVTQSILTQFTYIKLSF